jgi:hypothetical protein
VAEENGVDVSSQIAELENRAQQVRADAAAALLLLPPAACVRAEQHAAAHGARALHLSSAVTRWRGSCTAAAASSARAAGDNCHSLPCKPLCAAASDWCSAQVVTHPGPCLSAAALLYTHHTPTQLRKETYSRLTPTQRLQVARHPNRPTCLDIILNITGKRTWY